MLQWTQRGSERDVRFGLLAGATALLLGGGSACSGKEAAPEPVGSSGTGGDSATGSSGAGGGEACSPRSCASANAECGSISDGCGATLDCGTCSAPLSCGGDGTPHHCSQAYGWVQKRAPGSGYEIFGLWGARPDDFWAATGSTGALGGGGGIQHFDGTSWELYYSMGTPALDDVFGIGTDVFFVGRGQQFYWVDPSGVLQLDTAGVGSVASYNAVWASSPDAVWLGVQSVVSPLKFWNGSQYEDSSQHTRSPDTAPVSALWGSSANDVWAADDDGLLHFDGQSWTLEHPIDVGAISGIHGTGPNDVWAAGPRKVLHFDGQSWSEQRDGADRAINDVWAAGPNDVWLVGEDGRILHGGSSGLSVVASGTTEPLYSVWGTGAHDIWAGGGGGILLHYEPVDAPIETPDAGAACSTGGEGCTNSPCCAPFRCLRLTGEVLVCG